MTDEPLPSLEMVTLAARLAALPLNRGSGFGRTVWTGTAVGHASPATSVAVVDVVGITDSVDVRLIHGNPLDYLLSLSPEELLKFYAWLLPTVIVGLQDPKHAGYGALFTLWFFMFVIRAINQKKS